MKLSGRIKLRLVEVNGHQEFWSGWFHCFTSDGKAIVENASGGISLVDAHKITFID